MEYEMFVGRIPHSRYHSRNNWKKSSAQIAKEKV